MRVVVNLSARQFLQPNLVESVRAALEASSLEASRLELDLTEASVMIEGDEVTERLRQLRRLGVQLALDDFGTGYFSIRRIRDLGFRRLKIDRSLVSELPQGVEQAAQVDAILALGKEPGARRGRRRRRDRGAARLPGVEGLHRPAGLPAEPPARRRGRARLLEEALLLDRPGRAQRRGTAATTRSSSSLVPSSRTPTARVAGRGRDCGRSATSCSSGRRPGGPPGSGRPARRQ